ncbi:MAG TPA: hypothetical protein VJR47_04430 [Stellaceae bacterium]|nr:hypothetical protein [Stellaceae bacterium]
MIEQVEASISGRNTRSRAIPDALANLLTVELDRGAIGCELICALVERMPRGQTVDNSGNVLCTLLG